MKPAWKTWIAVLAPLLVMLGWITQHSIAARGTGRIELPIAGYDPRDLLSGHYLRFTVDYGIEPCKGAKPLEEACVCFGAAPSKPAKGSWKGACAARPDTCGLFVRGRCQEGGHFETGLNRFYIAETATKKAAVTPPNSSITVVLGSDGKARLSDMLVEGEPFATWLEKQPSSPDDELP